MVWLPDRAMNGLRLQHACETLPLQIFIFIFYYSIDSFIHTQHGYETELSRI